MDKARISIVGSGYMGGGMAQVFALAGHKVLLADVDGATSIAGRERLMGEAWKFQQQGLFPDGSLAKIEENITAVSSIEDASRDADYIAEVVPENLDIKTTVLARISSSAAPDSIIATNTSAISISTLAHFVESPHRFLGVHWMNPAPFVPSVELISSARTSRSVLEKVELIINDLGKVTTRVSDSAGFVANRLQFALFREAALIVEEELATPDQIDEVVSNSFGFRLPFFGPFAIADMAGLDVYAGAYETLQSTFGDRLAPPSLLTDLVAQGKLGVKTGEGFRSYDATEAGEMAERRNRSYAALSSLRDNLNAQNAISTGSGG
ncbi:3-hydroxyacyl-CoA dehydrogenase family protein [Cryobacterium sp. Hh11]|uniref:3-hydroxyacyl-CoA dehydrogenase family protein n=1 Tax=Cryobacterium sp. Hh11 TaxID=2555868 RepID=UPI001068F8FD|nr:3-hydroxyacyl-CoA dehydrogenase family protein [Cryobacterium sp. Hh11]TFD48729.1 3-hydroxyacyl-CoA dehydrogenase family protein [Cryobacterium sp. Hh11]